MESMDHGGGGAGLLAVAAAPAPAAVLTTMHGRELSHSSCSFSSAAASLSSPSSSTSSRSYHAAMSGKSLSCESIPEIMDKQSSFSSSASSYESFIQLEAADLDRITAAAAATRAPAVQTMMASHEQQQLAVAGGSGGYDPKRLPSSIFRTRSTSSGGGGGGGDWSVASNDSLFSINLRHSGDLSARYNSSNHSSSGDLFYDASGGGFHRIPSSTSAAAAAAAAGGGGGGGGLCVSGSCARCTTIAAGKNRKSVRFAPDAEIVSGEITNPSAVFPTEAAAPATEGKEAAKSPDAAAQGGWCLFRCCWPSPPSVWWPRCGCGGGCGVFCCGGENCRC
ncbi:hypothetical protein DAI22_05g064800 [Oryza sativa Japonica Group]|jgi:hypothetical protein|nr:hypothetical protein DAI22_05g064800 [Oryza sativa Japonica Group]